MKYSGKILLSGVLMVSLLYSGLKPEATVEPFVEEASLVAFKTLAPGPDVAEEQTIVEDVEVVEDVEDVEDVEVVADVTEPAKEKPVQERVVVDRSRKDSNTSASTFTPAPAPAEKKQAIVPSPKPAPAEKKQAIVSSPKPAPVEEKQAIVPSPEPAPAEEKQAIVPSPEPAPAEEKQAIVPPALPQEKSVTYLTHTVVAGNTFWNIALQYGIPMTELLNVNQMTESTPIQIGMKLTVPQHHIPQKTTPGPQFGELLDWWTEAQYFWPIGSDARIIDFKTGKSFMARRTVGAFHADVEPLTAEDARIMQEIWGGWSWNTRPVMVEVKGRRLAASANGMPHSIQTITNNNFNGHFCIHFLNSTRHSDNLVQADHQQNIRIAAGQ